MRKENGGKCGFHGMTYDTDDNIQGKKKIGQGGGREGEERGWEGE